MIKQLINVDNYWKVIVYYNVDYNFFDIVIRDVANTGTPVKEMVSILNLLHNHKIKAVTINKPKIYTSYIIFGKHKTIPDYISSIVHEAEHVKEAMLNKYNVDNYGEPPAYTIGFLVKEMYSVFADKVTRM